MREFGSSSTIFMRYDMNWSVTKACENDIVFDFDFDGSQAPFLLPAVANRAAWFTHGVDECVLHRREREHGL